MSWAEREYDDEASRRLGRPGGDWSGLRPSFDNPMSWSLPLGRVFGIDLRIHVVFLAYIVLELARSLGTPDKEESGPMEFSVRASMLGCLLAVVLLHEFGHCLACRACGGRAEEILMWPLGGLAYCQPPQRWSAHLITALGGLAVNFMICGMLAPTLGILTGQWNEVAFPDPTTNAGIRAVDESWTLTTLYMVNMTSFVLLWFNLLPVFPLDGGRIVQSLLWSRMGYARSMRATVRIGYVVTIILAVAGVYLREMTVVLVALFGGVTCFITHKQLEFTEQALGLEGEEYAMSVSHSREDEARVRKPTRAERRAQRRDQQERAEALEVDRILQKIASTGMGSLTRSERRLLNRVTERKRRSEDPREH